MRIVNWALTLLIAAVLIGCSGSYHKDETLFVRSGGTHSMQDGKLPYVADADPVTGSIPESRSVSGIVRSESIRAHDPSISRLFEERDRGLPAPATLEKEGERGTSGVGREWQDGIDYLLKAPNAVETATSLSLFTGTGQRNWAIYRLMDVSGPLGFEKLVVETSNPNFIGDNPGFIVGIANYGTGRWEVLDSSESEIYARTLTGFSDYLSPLGNVHVFVLTHNGNGMQLDRVGFDVDRDPPLVTSVEPAGGETGSSIQPVATFSGQVEDWSWNFGGGATPDTSTEESPLVTLGDEGSYAASVTASSPFGEHTFEFTLEVGPLTGDPPVVESVSPLDGETGSEVQFAAIVTGSVDTWAWDFGDAASPSTSDQPDPTVTLGEVGTYNCSLTASNAFGSDQFDFSFEVTDVQGEAPVIVSVDPLSGETGAEITFTPTYTGTVETWDWQFGAAASPDSSPDENPLVTLGAPGTYECSVTASNSFGNDTLNFNFEVTGNPGFQWTEVDLSSITGTEGGHTPSIAIADNGNPMVAYANLDEAVLDPYVVIGDSSLDLTAPASWTPLEVVDLGVSAPALPIFTDIVIPAGTNLPRVSFNVWNLAGDTAAQNSVVGFSALDIYDSVPTWNTYYLGNEEVPSVLLDGATSTSIDLRSTDGHIGICTHVDNSNLPAKDPNDLYYYDITYDPLLPDNISYTLTYGFGSNFLFPHMRFHSTTGEMQCNVNGANLLREYTGSWAFAFQNADSGVLGSLDLYPGGNTGLSYQSISGTDTGLRYAELDSADSVVTDEDITIVTDSGSGEEVALVTQLAYMPDGTACIVYTEFDGSGTHIRFAIQDGGGWSLEDVSSTPNTNTPGLNDVFVDLAHFANGNSMVCYSRFDSDVNTLRVAIRAPGA